MEGMDFEFKFSSKSDSDYVKHKDSSKSITECVTYLNGAPTMYQASTQEMISLSVKETEMNTAVTLIQDMLFAYEIAKSFGLEAKLSTKEAIENSIGGQTCHVEFKTNFL